MKLFKKLVTFAPLVALPITVVACGRDVNTDAKNKQDVLFAGKNVKDVVESLWLEATLNKVYSVSGDALDNATFKHDAYQVYKTFVKINLQKDSKYLTKEIAKLLSNGILKDAEYQKLKNLTETFNPEITLEQFEVLYKIKESNVKLEVQKQLLVNKYLTTSKSEDLQKINSSTYSSRKNDYDLNNFMLIDYLINKKTLQVWSYESSSDSDIFTSSVKTINNIDDYNQISQRKFDASKVATSDVLLSDREFETTLGGYKGLETSSYEFDYSITALKELNAESVVNGFYDYKNKKLVKVNADKTLASSISAAPEGSKIKISYLNRLVPLGKDFLIDNPNEAEKAKTPKINVKKLTLEGTSFANDLVKLTTSLYSNDSSLLSSAIDAFVALGNKIKLNIEDENLKKAVEGLKYVG
ncbi:HinT-interacting membrane complex lipoprotein P60 [Mycoplasmopsis edwardii]|uniref:Uncharacterized protein n=1 Tax=Mycoplasmopsis edwardii TaxID=53558 RepID=A0ACD4PH86_9BACT|nr:hypothetical protein [Mycoplasmopsis edwardii]WBP84007.1 hypothetical protein Me_995_000640 [Mycoplasmopsis edwardii]